MMIGGTAKFLCAPIRADFVSIEILIALSDRPLAAIIGTALSEGLFGQE